MSPTSRSNSATTNINNYKLLPTIMSIVSPIITNLQEHHNHHQRPSAHRHQQHQYVANQHLHQEQAYTHREHEQQPAINHVSVLKQMNCLL
jgi:hypothetical protein